MRVKGETKHGGTAQLPCQSLPSTRTSEEGQEKGIYALSCLMGRVDLPIVTLSVVSQTEKDKYCISLMCGI